MGRIPQLIPTSQFGRWGTRTLGTRVANGIHPNNPTLVVFANTGHTFANGSRLTVDLSPAENQVDLFPKAPIGEPEGCRRTGESPIGITWLWSKRQVDNKLPLC